jgi:hypothetical protein
MNVSKHSKSILRLNCAAPAIYLQQRFVLYDQQRRLRGAPTRRRATILVPSSADWLNPTRLVLPMRQEDAMRAATAKQNSVTYGVDTAAKRTRLG